MHRHQSAIFRLVRGLVGNAEEALDLTQDCFVSAFSHLRKYDGARPLRAWLSRIAINKCRDWRRRQRVRQLFIFSAATSDDE
ncbi:RNA polymerase sigma factor, partial [Acinetobacter baumannii]